MRVLRNPWWWGIVVLFILHQALQRLAGVDITAIDNYFDPFCAVPILLGLWRLERQLVFGVPQLSIAETVVATAALGIVFEEVFPRYQLGFSRDVIDYAFYALGGAYFYFLINRK